MSDLEMFGRIKSAVHPVPVYFGFEKDFADRWCPVLWYSKPTQGGANGKKPERSRVVEVFVDSTDSTPFAAMIQTLGLEVLGEAEYRKYLNQIIDQEVLRLGRRGHRIQR